MLEESDKRDPCVDDEVRSNVNTENIPEWSLFSPDVEQVHNDCNTDVGELHFQHFIFLEESIWDNEVASESSA